MKRIMIAAVLALATLTLVGCPAKSTVAALTSILGNASSSLASIEGNSTLATQISTDTAAAVKAIQGWQNGSPAQDAIQALNIVEDDINLIPIKNDTVKALVVLTIGTAESILALIPSPPSTAHAMGAKSRTIHMPMANAPQTADEFKAQWNQIVAQEPSLAGAALK